MRQQNSASAIFFFYTLAAPLQNGQTPKAIAEREGQHATVALLVSRGVYA